MEHHNFLPPDARKFFKPLAEFQFLGGEHGVVKSANLPKRGRLNKNK